LYEKLQKGAFEQAISFDISNIIPKYEEVYKKALESSI
jgi:hypothetical protein